MKFFKRNIKRNVHKVEDYSRKISNFAKFSCKKRPDAGENDRFSANRHIVLIVSSIINNLE